MTLAALYVILHYKIFMQETVYTEKRSLDMSVLKINRKHL